MKVICLLNKIANGESVPLKIKYDEVIWYYDKDINDYDSDEWYLGDYLGRTALNEFINDEIEIIEEDKPIEKVKEIRELIEASFSKLEEAQDKINRLENELEEESK